MQIRGNGHAYLDDVLTEIADALFILRSHWAQRQPSAQWEAQAIVERLRAGQPIMEPGPHEPAPITYNELRYYTALARHLRALEAA